MLHRQIRRPSNNSVRFRVGDIMMHKRYHYRGVIYGWDPICKASDEWIAQMNVDALSGRAQSSDGTPLSDT